MPASQTSPRRWRAWPLCLALAAACTGLALAQPFDFFHVGSFQRMQHTGNTAGQAALATLPQRPGTWGVGAMAGLRGEIVQIDGRLLVSPGTDAQGRVQAPGADEQALLFASARATRWVDVPVPTDLDQAGLEAFVRAQAAAHGLAADQPFAFRVEGRLPQLRWHVVTGEPPAAGQGGGHAGHAGGHGGGHGHANARSGMRVFHAPGATGQLVGIVSGAALEGVVSHPGERFHLHFVDAAATVSGHVDAYAVAAGAVLKLPLP